MNYDDVLIDAMTAAENAGFERGTKEHAEIVSALIKATAIEKASMKLYSGFGNLERSINSLGQAARQKPTGVPLGFL